MKCIDFILTKLHLFIFLFGKHTEHEVSQNQPQSHMELKLKENNRFFTYTHRCTLYFTKLNNPDYYTMNIFVIKYFFKHSNSDGCILLCHSTIW